MAYLHPVLDRPNLTVETHVYALAVLFEGERAVAVGGARLSEPLDFRRVNTNGPTIALAERAADVIRGRAPLNP